jgi:hypothetical protein
LIETEEPSEHEEMEQEVTSLEETDYSSVDWGIALKQQTGRGQKKKKHQAFIDRNLAWKQDIYPINKLTFSRQPGINQNLEKFFKENSLIHSFNVCFGSEIFR